MMKKLTLICCSVLQKELEAVLKEDFLEAEQVFVDSMLHMNPEKLFRAMASIMKERPESSFLIVFGDCHPFMHDMARRPSCKRTHGANCAEILLGKESYTRYRNERAFLFLPEWCLRWREVFEKELGFTDRFLAREFMQETRNSLVYLDTGIVPIPGPTLVEIADFFDMPVQTAAVSLDHLRRTIHSEMAAMARIPAHDI